MSFILIFEKSALQWTRSDGQAFKSLDRIVDLVLALQTQAPDAHANAAPSRAVHRKRRQLSPLSRRKSLRALSCSTFGAHRGQITDRNGVPLAQNPA